MMNIDERNKRMGYLFEECLGLSKAKGQDYAGKEDSLANLRIYGFKGILVRLFDKLMRLKSIEESGNIAVKDESVRDTLMDTLVYAALAIIMLEEHQDKDRVLTNPIVGDEESAQEYEVFSHPNPKRWDSKEERENWDEKIGR